MDPIDVLLVVATDVEADAVFAASGSGEAAPTVLHGENRTYFDLGVIGGARTAMVQTEAGTATVGGSLATILTAIGEVRPATVIMVGIAFGVSNEKQPIGTVLVSKQVQQYEIQRVGTSNGGKPLIIPRGDRATASPRVLNRLRAARALAESGVQFGLVLSGEKLVDNVDYRNLLTSYEAEALGGEMEGGGLYIAATEQHLDWCIAKAVCDYADGNKGEDKKERQRIAAESAAAYVLAALRQGGFATQENSSAGDPAGSTATPDAGSEDLSQENASILPGWLEVDRGFLDTQTTDLSPSALNLYFDGAVPHWRHALSPEIPRRGLVGEVREKLEGGRQDGSGPLFQILLGAGGEGKSTALLQIAADIAELDDWVVLWRPEPEIRLDVATFLDALDRQQNWLLVVDDADSIVSDLFGLARALGLRGLANVHVLACARDSDWRAAKGPWKSWSAHVEFRDVLLRGIDHDDADRITKAWAVAPPEGRGLALDGAGLVRATKASAVRGEGSFFGGVLAERFSPNGLLAHLKDLMLRLHGREVGCGTLRDALGYAAMCHAIGIPGLDYRVLADLLGVEHRSVRSKIERPLGDEAGAVRAGTAVLTRHRRVAEVVVQLLDSDFDEDIGRGYADIVRQTIHTAERGHRLWPHGHVVHCGAGLVRNLPKAIPSSHRGQAAVAAAQAAHEAEPSRLTYVVDLAKAWRTAGEPEGAVELLRGVIPSTDDHVDFDNLVRGYYYEWSVAEGEAGRKRNDIWLTAYSMSDILPAALTNEQMKLILAGLGVACLDISGRESATAVAKCMRACSVLGLKTQPDKKTQSYFARYKSRSDQNGVARPSSDAEALNWIAQVVAAVEPEVSRYITDLAPGIPLTFQALAIRLGISPSNCDL
jgi:nucleoside phosphorylase